MAKVKLIMPDDFEKRLTSLGKNEDAIAEKVLEAGAEVVLPKVKSSLAGSIGRNTKVESRSTGELLGSLGVSPMKQDKDGNNNVHVGFNEPRRKQYAARGKRSYFESTNAMIANVLEYGRHGQPAKPFLKPAAKSAQSAAQDAMRTKFLEEVDKL